LAPSKLLLEKEVNCPDSPGWAAAWTGSDYPLLIWLPAAARVLLL